MMRCCQAATARLLHRAEVVVASIESLLTHRHGLEVHGALQAGVSLSSRNVISMVAILYATTSVSHLGAASLAAHEILRQARPSTLRAFQPTPPASGALALLAIQLRSHAYSSPAQLKPPPPCRRLSPLALPGASGRAAAQAGASCQDSPPRP